MWSFLVLYSCLYSVFIIVCGLHWWFRCCLLHSFWPIIVLCWVAILEILRNSCTVQWLFSCWITNCLFLCMSLLSVICSSCWISVWCECLYVLLVDTVFAMFLMSRVCCLITRVSVVVCLATTELCCSILCARCLFSVHAFVQLCFVDLRVPPDLRSVHDDRAERFPLPVILAQFNGHSLGLSRLALVSRARARTFV